MPVAGQGSERKDRERTVWGVEDEEIWGADGDDVAPPLIE
jgi:hypothetical protein